MPRRPRRHCSGEAVGKTSRGGHGVLSFAAHPIRPDLTTAWGVTSYSVDHWSGRNTGITVTGRPVDVSSMSAEWELPGPWLGGVSRDQQHVYRGATTATRGHGPNTDTGNRSAIVLTAVVGWTLGGPFMSFPFGALLP
jgi:hypothetical protein